jgi:hypothetical protein
MPFEQLVVVQKLGLLAVGIPSVLLLAKGVLVAKLVGSCLPLGGKRGALLLISLPVPVAHFQLAQGLTVQLAAARF